VIYKVWTDGDPNKQYFLVEHRRRIGFDASIRGEGVVIYHVDDRQDGNDFQRCGPGTPHYLVAVEQADGECDLEYDSNSGDAGDPWPGQGGTHNPGHAFNLLSTPNSNKYSDVPTAVSVYNIREVGSDAYVSIAVAPVSPYVEITSPDGGESYGVGEQQTITWVAFDDLAVDSVSILCSRDGGLTYPETIASGLANDSSYVWDVEGPGASECRIKVITYDNSGNASEDVSDANFEIVDDLSGIAGTADLEFGIISINPNPTASGTRITFAAPSRSIEARVYDVRGRIVASLAPERAASASNTFQAEWDGRNRGGSVMAPGVYFVRITSGDRSSTQRIMIAR
jgi:hypothetical protein